ncbi:hypothetical protein ACJ41O_012617 [Fusarium nematophilum]
MDDSDSDDSIGPVELPSGRLVCRPHGQVVCGYCCVDYSFMDEVLEEESMEREDDGPCAERHLDEASLSGSEPDIGPTRAFTRGTGRVIPTRFIPPSAASTPGELFPIGLGIQAIPPVTRFIRRDNQEQFLIYADGACLGNGQANPKAGWAFVFKPETTEPAGIVSGRLEKQGPFGDEHAQTSNRAELRAILGALRFRHWPGEGCTTLVFATDSEYVVKGATEWTRGWVRNGWRTRTGAEVKNKDLWEMLLGEAERWDSYSLKIQL